jgi:uncharacterized protein (TIGR00661 family)
LDNINIHRVLIAPLDWGLGHAARCIPIIKAFQSLKNEVIIAADGAPAKLLSNEFPEIRIIHLNGYHIQYAKTSKAFTWKLFKQIPKILKSIKNEHAWLEQIIEKEKIDLVISDNRYGLYTPKVPCVFITHQLLIKTPFKYLDHLIQKINYRYINRFSVCWVPDASGENNIGGILSHPKILPSIPVHYLGILARMKRNDETILQFDVCFLLSGPEPQRTILENTILKSISKISGSIIMVRGLPGTDCSIVVPKNVQVFNHLPTNELSNILSLSKLIICRSGYTSIMELIGLNKNAILIPTLGQTEQEYLAEKLHFDHRFLFTNQDGLDLIRAITLSKDYSFDKSDLPTFTTNKLEFLLQEL